MKRIGRVMFIFGIASIGLFYFNMELIILSWIDTWGPDVAWAIRVGLVVVGGVLWVAGVRRTKHAPSPLEQRLPVQKPPEQ